MKKSNLGVVIVATLLLVLLAILGTISDNTPAPTPTPTPAPTAEPCPGEPITIGEATFLANDDHGRPVVLMLGKGFEICVTLYGEIEHPEGSGNYVQFQPSLSVVRERDTELEWRGVKIVVRECVEGLVYRYDLLEKP